MQLTRTRTLDTGHIYVTTKTPGHLRLSSQFPIATNCRYMRLPDHNIARWSEDVSAWLHSAVSAAPHPGSRRSHGEESSPSSQHTTYHRHGGRPTLIVVKFCFELMCSGLWLLVSCLSPICHHPKLHCQKSTLDISCYYDEEIIQLFPCIVTSGCGLSPWWISPWHNCSSHKCPWL